MTTEIRPYGRRALLVAPDDPGHTLRLLEATSRLPGLVEAVPGARTVLLRFAEPSDAASAAERLPAVRLDSGDEPAASAGVLVVLDVSYDGPDLPAVAAAAGMSVADVVAHHSASTYVVAFCGFAPGFAYLTGLPAALQMPRLAGPRQRVPAGSVGVAGEFTGVYPRASPGGWRLLGRTTATLWNAAADPPATLVPGARVRFRPA